MEIKVTKVQMVAASHNKQTLMGKIVAKMSIRLENVVIIRELIGHQKNKHLEVGNEIYNHKDQSYKHGYITNPVEHIN